MGSLLLLRRISHPRIQSPAPSSLSLSLSLDLASCPHVLLRSYHAGKASSVNTAIQRGLRKSKGVGFRGKSKPHPNDLREVYRERNDIPAYDYAAAKADSLARGKREGSRLHDTIAGSDSRSIRARDGLEGRSQHSRGEAILRSGGFRESDIRGRFGEKLTPRIRKFEHKETRPGRGSHRERTSNPPTSESRYEATPDAHTYAPSSKPDYQSRSHDSTSNDVYPLLSFRDRASGSTSQTRAAFDRSSIGRNSEDRYASPSKQSSNGLDSGRRSAARVGTPQLDRPVRISDNKTLGQTSRSFEPRPHWRDGDSTDRYPSARSNTRPSDRSGTGHSERNVRLDDSDSSSRTSRYFDSRLSMRMGESKEGYFSRAITGNPGSGSSARSVTLDPRVLGDVEQSHEKRNGNHQGAALRVSQVFDKHIPLSIPYTTPASEFLYGTSVVEAALTSRRFPKRKLYKLYIYTGEHRKDEERDSRLKRLAQKSSVEVVRVGNDWLRLLDKMSAGRPHNGYILEASPLPRMPVACLGELNSDDGQEGFEVSVDHQSKEEAAVNGTSNFIRTINGRSGRKPLVLLLDSIVDPGNLGGIIRTASFLGVSAIAISARNSASFTPVVLKASAGASENITLFTVNKPAGFVVDSKAAGWRVYAAVAPSKRNDPSMQASISTDELEDPLSEAPCILMLGSEGEGLRWNLRSKADVDLYIRGCGQSFNVDSLNVSVATGILCHSFLSNNGGKMAESVAEEPSVETPSRVESAVSASALF
ncbi:hypothetical protein BKA65DRAFT_499187 [Rhexocercosporidium sp. MPI-PUGE-AT-0058]|nr:hypothetical protein BKA65DRAFT_499187 [Rhexocercosporidium sp. MPI-PUGE-AT-0058]